MKQLVYIIGSMSQFHQIVFISLLSSIITSLIKLKVKDKADIVYQLMVVGIYIVLELGLDALVIYYFIGRLDISTILAEVLTIISGIALSLILYDTWKKIYKGVKELCKK